MKKVSLGVSAAGALLCCSFLASAAEPGAQPDSRLAHTSSVASAKEDASPLPWSEIGTKVGADYQGDGLSVTAAGNGARLRCAFQRLDGEATTEGLWIVSSVTNAADDRFRVVAGFVGRLPQQSAKQTKSSLFASIRTEARQSTAVQDALALPRTGTVQVADKLVRFLRPGLVEEYSVSVDGVRQDFVLTERLAGDGELQVQLAVSGARVESSSERPSRASVSTSPEDLAVLVLTNSGRRIAYSRLRATDATGRELPSRIEVQEISAFSLQPPAFPLAVVVDDLNAVYPVRIDPTFSDANWISMGGLV